MMFRSDVAMMSSRPDRRALAMPSSGAMSVFLVVFSLVGTSASVSQSRTRGHITKSNYGGKPLEPRDLTETLGQRRPSRRLRLARGSEPDSVPFSRNALYYLSQEKRGSSTCLKSKLEELEGDEASSSKGRMRAQRRAPDNLLGLRGAIRRSSTNIKNEQI